jgi:hypothetical protein
VIRGLEVQLCDPDAHLQDWGVPEGEEQIPAASSRRRGAAGPVEFPRVVGGGATGTIAGPDLAATILDASPAPNPPLWGLGQEVRGWDPSGENFPS